MARKSFDPLTKKKIKRLSTEDYERIVCYIEDPDNFASLHGAGRKTKLGSGKPLSKTRAFNIMAARLSGLSGFPNVTGDELRKRYDRYIDMYKKAKAQWDEPGFGVTEAEAAIGFTLEMKLNAKCPHFYRMKAIFGEQMNVSPRALLMMGIPAGEETALDGATHGVPEVIIDPEHSLEDIILASNGISDEVDHRSMPYSSVAEEEGDFAGEPQTTAAEETTMEDPIVGSAIGSQTTTEHPRADYQGQTERSRVEQQQKPVVRHVNRVIKRSLMTIYEDAQKSKSHYRRDMMQWKAHMLEDRKQAREEMMLERRLDRVHADKRQRITIASDMLREGMSQEEIRSHLDFFDSL